ncbi:MAG: SIS domain-containing protein [Candidatus Zambryskibacteria bacterium]|nr:SIS domain-containing protein [Candidatus Zambryskibacteria bacterium]
MQTSESLVGLYIDEQMGIARAFPVAAAARFCNFVLEAYDRGSTIYMAANGGPAGFCDNFATDLYFHPFVSDDKSKPVPTNVKRMKVVNLTASSAMLTSVMNDLGANLVFAQQLEGHMKDGDIFLGFSGSGNSANILEAIAVAKKCGAIAVAITRGSGGKCKEFADLCIVIPGTSTFPGQIGKNNNNFHFEDCLSSISHMAVGILQKHVREKYGL